MQTHDMLQPVAEATLRRLPSYFRYLREVAAEGQAMVSCTQIAERFGQDPTQVRKDLQATGGVGKPRTGFEVKSLQRSIADYLGWNNTRDAFLVGAGNLGAALLGYEGFEPSGLNILAVFDSDPAKIGTRLGGKPVMDIARFGPLVRRMHVLIGILAVPARAAQEVADLMLASGIRGLWNFSPRKLKMPPEVVIENADLTPSLALLSAKLRQRLEQEERDAL